MGKFFYNVIWAIGSHAFWVSSRPVVIGREQMRREGAFIVGAAHDSNFDIALIIRHSKRFVDPLAAAELSKKPFPRWFLRCMNSVSIERSRKDPGAVLQILKRLERGRVVAIFPEGRVQQGEESAVHTQRIRPGVGRVAKLANVPIVPCVVLGASAYWKVRFWLPVKAVRYGIIFGEAIMPEGEAAEIEGKLLVEWRRLHGILVKAMKGEAT